MQETASNFPAYSQDCETLVMSWDKTMCSCVVDSAAIKNTRCEIAVCTLDLKKNTQKTEIPSGIIQERKSCSWMVRHQMG